jgi:hypothetical protein
VINVVTQVDLQRASNLMMEGLFSVPTAVMENSLKLLNINAKNVLKNSLVAAFVVPLAQCAPNVCLNISRILSTTDSHASYVETT